MYGYGYGNYYDYGYGYVTICVIGMMMRMAMRIGMCMVMVMIMVLGYFLLWVPEKRRRNALKEKLDSMKENDHVITAGGIHGTVTGIRRDQDMVTIRIDEATGTKIRLGRSAIAQVLSDDDSNDTDPKTKT